MKTPVELSDRERIVLLQGYIAGSRSVDRLGHNDLDALDHFAVISEQILTGGAYNPLHVYDCLRFIEETIVPRSDLVIVNAGGGC